MPRQYTRSRTTSPDSRTPLARAIGLGSARTGVGHWWAQRVSAIALAPLLLWFTAAIIAHVGSDYATVTAWLKSLPVATLIVLLLIMLFYHMALGVQVVIEDYIHTRIKVAFLITARLGCLALAVTGILAVLRVAMLA